MVLLTLQCKEIKSKHIEGKWGRAAKGVCVAVPPHIKWIQHCMQPRSHPETVETEDQI